MSRGFRHFFAIGFLLLHLVGDRADLTPNVVAGQTCSAGGEKLITLTIGDWSAFLRQQVCINDCPNPKDNTPSRDQIMSYSQHPVIPDRLCIWVCCHENGQEDDVQAEARYPARDVPGVRFPLVTQLGGQASPLRRARMTRARKFTVTGASVQVRQGRAVEGYRLHVAGYRFRVEGIVNSLRVRGRSDVLPREAALLGGG